MLGLTRVDRLPETQGDGSPCHLPAPKTVCLSFSEGSVSSFAATINVFAKKTDLSCLLGFGWGVRAGLKLRGKALAQGICDHLGLIPSDEGGEIGHSPLNVARSQMGWHTHVIPALKKQRQEHQDFLRMSR